MNGIEFYPQKEFDEDLEDKTENDKIRVGAWGSACHRCPPWCLWDVYHVLLWFCTCFSPSVRPDSPGPTQTRSDLGEDEDQWPRQDCEPCTHSRWSCLSPNHTEAPSSHRAQQS